MDDKTLEVLQREELLLDRVDRFRKNLINDCHDAGLDEFILEVMDRRIAEHREFLVINFMRDLKVKDAHDIKELLTRKSEPPFDTMQILNIEPLGKRGRGRPKREASGEIHKQVSG